MRPTIGNSAAIADPRRRSGRPAPISVDTDRHGCLRYGRGATAPCWRLSVLSARTRVGSENTRTGLDRAVRAPFGSGRAGLRQFVVEPDLHDASCTLDT